jgi:protoporphyrinogen oxidase
LQAARALRYRDFIVAGLIINAPELFPDNWLYIHSPDVRVGRIQNFKNWSRTLCPLPETTHVGLEYFCTAGDDLWEQTDADLISLAKREMVQLGLAQEAQILDGVVFRQPKAYPVYDENYRQNLEVLRTYLEGFENLQTFGRNGLHRYNNQDHSMLSAMLAVRNLEGERHDLWNVNTERSYLEDYPSET